MEIDREAQKRTVAEAAIDYIEDDMVVGVGTGSTVNYFIDALATVKHKIEGAVASSNATEQRLKQHGITVFDANVVDSIPVYIDGADEVNPDRQLIKGGGGALTREKIVATIARKFICLVDSSKQVELLGQFPLPIEVIPMARSYVARQLVKLGGDPVYREGVVTDNGNILLDVFNLKIMEPLKFESELNDIVGVVCNGLFAHRSADLVLIASEAGLKEM